MIAWVNYSEESNEGSNDWKIEEWKDMCNVVWINEWMEGRKNEWVNKRKRKLMERWVNEVMIVKDKIKEINWDGK